MLSLKEKKNDLRLRRLISVISVSKKTLPGFLSAVVSHHTDTLKHNRNKNSFALITSFIYT